MSSLYKQTLVLEMREGHTFLNETRDAFVISMNRKKLKKRELAHRLGITPETLRYKLEDPGKFTVGEFVIACQVLNINPKTLISYE